MAQNDRNKIFAVQDAQVVDSLTAWWYQVLDRWKEISCDRHSHADLVIISGWLAEIRRLAGGWQGAIRDRCIVLLGFGSSCGVRSFLLSDNRS